MKLKAIFFNIRKNAFPLAIFKTFANIDNEYVDLTNRERKSDEMHGTQHTDRSIC